MKRLQSWKGAAAVALLLLPGLATCLLAATSAAAQEPAYPAKRITYIVPQPPAGPNDFIARLVAEHLTRSMGQPVVVENRPGGSGQVGTEYAVRQPADGYTLLNAASSHVLNALLLPKLPYDALNDFAWVSQTAGLPFMLTVHSALGVRDVREFIALARANPGKLTYASVGSGSPHHLAAEMLRSMANIEMLHVPYKGGAQITQALLAREVDAVFISIFPVRKMVMAGTLRGLGVTTRERSPILPDVPVIAEAAGLPGFELDSWQGVVVRAGTAGPIVARLGREIAAAIQLPANAKRIIELGMTPAPSSPEAFEALARREHALWAKIIREAGIQVK